jgi:hypothetical protein
MFLPPIGRPLNGAPHELCRRCAQAEVDRRIEAEVERRFTAAKRANRQRMTLSEVDCWRDSALASVTGGSE